MSVACLAAVCWAAVRCWGSRRRETLNPQGLGLRSVVSRRRAQRMGMTSWGLQEREAKSCHPSADLQDLPRAGRGCAGCGWAGVTQKKAQLVAWVRGEWAISQGGGSRWTPQGLAVLGKGCKKGLEGLKQQLVRLKGTVLAVGQGAVAQDEQRRSSGQNGWAGAELTWGKGLTDGHGGLNNLDACGELSLRL